MHPDSFWVMVDGYINTVTGRNLYPCRRSASTGKVIDDNLSVNHHSSLSIIISSPLASAYPYSRFAPQDSSQPLSI